MFKKKNNKGFTLVELLVVIAIIGILAVVAVPALFKNIEKGKVADLESDMSAIRSAVLSYYADNSEYPMDDPTAGDATNIPNDEKSVQLKPTYAPALNDKKNAGTKALLSELEGLSFPYEGYYELTNATGDATGQTIVKSPSRLYLKMVTKDSNTNISANGIDKLAKDLGLEESATADSDGTKVFVTTGTGGDNGKQVIIIPLVNK
ncbi:type IV pilin protein [[Clostridium] dakarense]|uniref:type IV pilin protein n=1 Tax=Faecalimicrobium dakarense TaxID=1301100 RepID=UPI0004BC4A1B|nr:type II secretion system protein [[Clostridium] dakarense]